MSKHDNDWIVLNCSVAQARLFKAAPRLLEALKAGIHDGKLQTFEDRERWRAEARAAIAEAEGEEK